MSQSEKSSLSTRSITSLAMLSAVAYVVMWLSKAVFAPLTVAGFLTIDLKDTIIAISGFIFGALPAFLVSLVVSLVEMVSHSATGPVGMLMNVLSTVAFVCPAAWIYKKKHTTSGAVTGLAVGVVFMVAVMLLWNYIITPLYQHVPREVVAKMLVPVFLPFNAIKGLMNSACSMVLYKPVVTALRKAGLAPESRSTAQPKAGASRFSVTIIGLFVLATAILLAMVLAGKL